MANERISIKGTSSGLIVNIGAGAWHGLLIELDETLGQKASFFKGGRVALRVGPRQLTRPQLEAVGEILKQHDVTLWAVEGEASGTQEAADQLGLETSMAPVSADAETTTGRPTAKGSIIVRRTLRSGQVIHHSGDVVVIGDVNPGAEVKAGGSVIIWGRLRGSVYAGSAENRGEGSVVCALQLSPVQLRIGNLVARAPADAESHEIMPEMAFVHDGQIVAEPWS
jgi:septum site-determining protein MinC